MNEPKSARYHRLKRLSGALSLLCTAGALVILLVSGGSAVMRDVASSIAPARPVAIALYVIALSALLEATSFPLALYRGFVLERRYELSSERFTAWLRDHLKALALTTVLTLVAAEVVFALIAWDPRRWWIAAALLGSAATIGLASIAPVLLLPMFYKFRPLQRQSLTERLLTLSRDAGVRVLGVYEWGLGAKTRRANAALVGTGGTRRILLSDTLLAEYTDDEIEVILAHELAHHVHHDIFRGLVLEAVVLLTAAFAGAVALDSWSGPLGLTGPADIAGLPLLLLAAGAVTLAVTPLINALSRLHERRADRFALQLTRRRDAFVSAMRRLASQNLVEEHPSRATVWLFHTHPPIEERIESARLS